MEAARRSKVRLRIQKAEETKKALRQVRILESIRLNSILKFDFEFDFELNSILKFDFEIRFLIKFDFEIRF